jgi:hypothetical protein
MKLTAKYDVEAPADFVFAELADFESWERAAMRRGADIMRTDSLTRVAPGMAWDCQFSYRNRARRSAVTLVAITPATGMTLAAASAPVNATLQIDLMELAARRTRVEVRIEVKPNTFTARIYVQSLRLARARLDRDFAKRVAQLALQIEERYKRKTS